MKKIYFGLIFSGLLIPFTLTSRKIDLKEGILINGFIENKGQILDQNMKPNPYVKFLLNTNGMNVQLKSNSFSYDTYTCEKTRSNVNYKGISLNEIPDKIINKYNFHRVDVEFIGANLNPEILSENASSMYFNYYTVGTSENGATKVKNFSKITYKNLYPFIDLEFLVQGGKVKFNFILHKGAELNKIKWQYKGSNGTALDNESVVIKLNNGTLNENIPESYLREPTKKRNIDISFMGYGKNVFGFRSSEEYLLTENQELIIDPTPNISWGTYLGGNLEDVSYNVITDVFSNVYMTGYSVSASAIATVGSFQSTFNGFYDCFISKFNSSGVIQWSTYYGGTGADAIYSSVSDGTSNIYVTGNTESTSFISTIGSYQSAFGGAADNFLAKFDFNGIRQWATYYGGPTYELGGSYIARDLLGNLYLTGQTGSSSSIATTGSFQSSLGGGLDAYIAKFDVNGNRLWATYFGGAGSDGPNSCCTDGNNNVVIVGNTSSGNSIASIGAQQNNLSGATDGFIAKFDGVGNRIWSSYYGGNGNENIASVKSDSFNNVYFAGWTDTSKVGISTIGSYQPTMIGPNDAFLIKFNSLGSRQWGTYFGGNDIDFCYAIDIDNSDDIYLTGHTSSTVSIATPGAFQINIAGNWDSYIAKFSSNCNFIWGTYLGGTQGDFARAIYLDSSKNIYVSGYTNSTMLISTSGSYQSSYGGGNFDSFVMKFSQTPGVGILENGFKREVLNVFPNPNNGSFEINSSKNIILSIVNELGEVVRIIPINQSNNHNATVTRLASGFYSIVDYQSGEKIYNKIVVIK